MLERSINARHAKAVFFTKDNDVDIYIEDSSEGAQKLFEILLQKEFGDRAKISKVFPIGPRGDVIEKCRQNQDNSGRKRIYIIDCDLDILLGTPLPPLKMLYRLPYYCIENALIDEGAILEFLFEEDSTRGILNLSAMLEFIEWKKHLESELYKLFIYYAIAKKHRPELETVGFKVNQLTGDDTGFLSKSKVEQRIQQIKDKLMEILTSDEIQIEYVEINNRTQKIGSVIDCISGKDYILPLLKKKIKKIITLSSSTAVLKNRLAIKVTGRMAGIDALI